MYLCRAKAQAAARRANTAPRHRPLPKAQPLFQLRVEIPPPARLLPGGAGQEGEDHRQGDGVRLPS